MKAKFKYFTAPLTDIFRFSDQNPCIHCGTIAPATQVRMGKDGSPNEYCCLACLSAGKEAIQHETVLGYVERGVVSAFDVDTLESVPVALPQGFRAESLAKLSRTPPIESHQGQGFLVHCSDFMCYIGRWDPEDSDRPGEGTARDAYIQMAGGDPQLWEETEKEKARYGDRWPPNSDSKWAYGSWCYVFECVHCGVRRCAWDCG